MAEIAHGTCDCGAQVEREVVTGFGARMMNGLPFVCADCVARAEYERELEEEAERQRDADERFARRIERSGLPLALREIEFGQLELGGCANAIDTASAWATGAIPGLLLTGPYGIGKTTIAAGALRLLLKHGHGRFLSAPLLMAKLGSGFRTIQHDDALEALTGTGALVLDDLDKARPTDYGSEHIFLAVDSAVSGNRPLLVTANLLPDQLAARYPEPYGEAIASRLAGYCEIRQMEGADRRLRP